MTTVPSWLQLLSTISLALALVSAAVIAVDEATGHAQRMWIMNVVWPVTGLWAGPLALFAYYRIGRAPAIAAGKMKKPFWQSVCIGALHCGSGCTLADLIVEWSVLAFPVTLFGSIVFGSWAVDFLVAFALGIAFQYFTIAPMKHLAPREGLVAALKADTLSLSAWQLGMYGWMAIALFVIFTPDTLSKTQPAFWFMMQLAMIAGFLTSYPVNWWLLRKGIKEAM
ncbi:MAG: DUF4396 domain-containing protein [Gemmatimonadaceae bacterium]